MALTAKEHKAIISLLKRKPNKIEREVFAAMWSEHCSYKSTKIWLRKLYTKNKLVLQGPGENAGAIDIGDNEALIFKIESHNHPSQIEPYNGAATGVGGILRDILVMGANPVALMNMLCFGERDKPGMQPLIEHVTTGIGDYANSMGVPTIGGKVIFDSCYYHNILVNVFAAGITKHSALLYNKADLERFDLFYLGAKTGHDGLGGAILASANFTHDIVNEREYNAQVANPFLGRCLLEAFRELHTAKLIKASTDLGAAGLVGAASELAANNALGIDLHLQNIPTINKNMTPSEILLSETQERILLVLHQDSEEKAQNIARKWGLDFAKIGQTNLAPFVTIYHSQQQLAHLPIYALTTHSPTNKLASRAPTCPKPSKQKLNSTNFQSDLLELLKHCNKASKHWFFEQFDSYVQGNTVLHPGLDASLIKLPYSSKALAFSMHVNPTYCAANPMRGAIQAVAQCWRNINAIGCKPLAITNNLNFGDPNNNEIMGQFIATIKGLTKASKVLNIPVVSGNVSLYNQTENIAIKPTPSIVVVGTSPNWQNTIAGKSLKEGDYIFLLGKHATHLDCSLYQTIRNNFSAGNAPKTNLKTELIHGKFIRNLIVAGLLSSCRSLGSGGLIAACALLSIQEEIGIRLSLPKNLNATQLLFGEDQSRYIIAMSELNIETVIKQAKSKKLHLYALGRVSGKNFNIEKICNIAIDKLKYAYYNLEKV